MKPGAPGAWVAASRSARPVYAGVVEHSIYVHADYGSRGLGRALLDAFVTASEDSKHLNHPIRCVPREHGQPGSAPGGGFRVLGTRERIGRHHGVWRDVVMIERRSPAI